MTPSSDGPRLARLGSLKLFVTTAASNDAETPEGVIVIPRRDAARPNVYATIYDALRSRMEIMRRYGVRSGDGSELERLSALRGDLAETDITLRAGAADGVDETFSSAAEALKRKRNIHKKQAAEKARAGAVRHATQTVNRGATRARLTAIDRRIALREDEVRSIAPWIGAMETALLLEVRRSETIVRDLDRTAQAMSRHELVRKGRTSDRQRKAVAARLRHMGEPLATLVAEPFLSVRRSLTEPMLRATVAAERGTSQEFADAIKVVCGVTGPLMARIAIEGVLVLIAGASSRSVVLKAAERAACSARKSLIGADVPIKIADTVQAAMRLAWRTVNEGNLEAAKPWFKEAITSIYPA